MLRRFAADFGGLYAANALVAFIFAASGPVAIILAVGAQGGLSESDLASWIFGSFFVNGLISIGFFITHSVASGAIGPLAGREKGHATSLYLLFYYLGSSVTGSFGGWVWQHGGWPALAALAGSIALVGVGLAATLKASRV